MSGWFDSHTRPRRPPQKVQLTPLRLEDLPDKLILRVLKELPQPELLKVARVSSRLHCLSQDSALWRDLCALGPDPGLDTNQACSMLRHAHAVTALRVQDRLDLDALLLEVSRYCQALERLHLTRCQGSKTFKGLSYRPLLKIAQKCHRLRELQFNETDFQSSRVFKIWMDLRGPNDPGLTIVVNKLFPQQAKYLVGVLGGPEELLALAARGVPVVLRVENHCLRIASERHSELQEGCDLAVEAGPSHLSGSRTQVTRIRPALSSSSSSSSEDLHRPCIKRPCRRETDDPADAESTAFVRIGTPDDASSTDPMGSEEATTAWLTSEPYDDDKDVQTAPLPPPAHQEYESLFSMALSRPANPPATNSWFTSGYIGLDDYELEYDDGGQHTAEPAEDQDHPVDGDAYQHVTDIAEEDVLECLTSPRPYRSLPETAVRLADSLKEPRPDCDDCRPGARRGLAWPSDSETSIGDHATERDLQVQQAKPSVVRVPRTEEGCTEGPEHL